MSDFKLFAKNFIQIVNNDGNLQLFLLNEQQEQFIDGISKYNIISKSRQLGFSTLSLAYCLFQAVTKPNTNYLIVSYKGDSSSALFERLKTMNQYLPRDKFPSLFPNVKRDNKGELLFDNGSRITCTVAGNKDVGRGSTYEYILLSEFAFYQNQEKVLLSAEQSLAKNENSKVVLETTSNGMNHYYKLFMSAWKGESKYKATFYPFYSSAYRELFKHDYDEAEKWFKEDNKGKRLSKDDLEKDEVILFNSGANLRQIMWKRWKMLDLTQQEFWQEYPSNPLESFISTSVSVFDQSKVLDRLQYVKEPLDKELVTDIPESLMPYLNKSLFIYSLPKKGRYYGGVDTASGSGGDNSTISIIDSDGEQVLSFYNNKVPIYEFAEIVNEIGRWFNYAFLAVESNSYGKPLLERLRNDYQYMNLYKGKIFDQRGRKKLQLGFTTTTATKPILISDFKEQFERNMILLHCKETLQQMQIYQEDEKGRTNAKRGQGNYDDLVISSALSVQAQKANKWYVD